MTWIVNRNKVFYIVGRINGKIKYLVKMKSDDKESAQKEHELWKEENKKLEEWKNKIVPMPQGEFDVIYADPPWRYDFSKSDNRAIENQYPTMEVSEICNLKVPSADNSVLFLWGTAPKLLEALEVMKSWGFQYKTNAVWDKRRIGMGYYFRIHHEHLLIGTKGVPGVPGESARPDSIFSQAKTQHSAKPPIVYDMIEAAYPDKKYLELFARTKRENWTTWGNQI